MRGKEVSRMRRYVNRYFIYEIKRQWTGLRFSRLPRWSYEVG